ncbi:MAG: hypothetical protein RL344_537 [Pseudomonadota bacterium]|jgi:RimJ/RimL family protein N-acetyltransferase
MNQLLLTPTIKKAIRLEGKNLVMRDATIEDATFILSLRTNEQKSKFLSTTDADIQKQKQWLQSYANQSNQAYFIIESLTGEPLGTVRLYDPKGDSFCWGSWIVKDNAPSSTAIESALMVYTYAIDCLGFTKAHFDVRKQNESVWKFHERFGAIKISETEVDYIYTIDKESILNAKNKYIKYLPNNIFKVKL